MKTCSIHRLITFHATTGWQQEVFVRYRVENPNYGDELLCLGRSLKSLGTYNELFGYGGRIGPDGWEAGDMVDFLEKLHMAFWHRVERKFDWVMQHKYGRKYAVKSNLFTEDIYELLGRGFVHREDRDYYTKNELKGKGKRFWIECKTASLIYPRPFEEKEEAEKFLDAYGLYGCYITSITIS